ncbi:MAG TPA: GAF domain-containing protein [Gemmatimonadales bacterium]|jgi:GAF domain-containing protein/multidrug resistance efflux pump|nr:GAF domain-containing protein [Gemmatimonadales bacterium]
MLSVPASSAEDLRDEIERLRLLHTISLEFSASLDFDELLPKVFQRVLAVLGAEGGSIWIAEGDLLCCRLATGGAAQKLVGARVPVGTGFVGDVAQRPRTTIVTRAAEDPRYEPRLDSGEMLATTVMATAMVTGGVTVGAIQVSNKLTGDGVFDHRDRELLEGLAASAAAALRNAQLHTVETRARDLALLLEISREITSTLDLDRVLRSVVNLASRALSFDRGAVGLYQKGECEIRAVAGQEKADPKDPKLKDLIARTTWASSRGEPLYLRDRTDPGSDAERMFVNIFGSDLESDDVHSGLYLPLKDEEGVLGVLAFEAARSEFATETQLELASILANQTAVALRNAQLYHQVPMVDALGALAAKKRAILSVPRRKLRLYAVVTVAVLAAMTLIPWPLRVTGKEAVFRPMTLAPVRALVPGVVERVLVSEGAVVERGMPLASLRASDIASSRSSTAAEVAAADRQAALAASKGDPTEERLHRIRSQALLQELALLEEQVEFLTVRAPVAGMVLTPRLHEQIGTSLDEGDLLMTLGRTDSLELEFGVAQRDIHRVRPGQEVRLRVDALPQRTFYGRVTSVGQLPFDTLPEVRYPVRAEVANAEGVLKPQMAAYARVLTEPTSAMGRIIQAPLRWGRLLWWKLWP